MYDFQNQYGCNPQRKIILRNTDLEKCEALYSNFWYMWDDCGKPNCWPLGFLGWISWISIIFPALNKITVVITSPMVSRTWKTFSLLCSFWWFIKLPTGLRHKVLIETLVKLWVSFSLFQSFLSILKGYKKLLQMTPANF